MKNITLNYEEVSITELIETLTLLRDNNKKLLIHLATIAIREDIYKEETIYRLKINHPGPNKLTIVKMVKDLTGWGLRESKDYVDNCPNDSIEEYLFESKSLQYVSSIKEHLENHGAICVLEEIN